MKFAATIYIILLSVSLSGVHIVCTSEAGVQITIEDKLNGTVCVSYLLAYAEYSKVFV